MLTEVDHIFQTIYKRLVTSCEISGKVSNKLFLLISKLEQGSILCQLVRKGKIVTVGLIVKKK